MGYLMLSVIAATALVVSISVHFMAWVNIDPPFHSLVPMLHVGAIILGIPLVLFAELTKPKTAGRNNLGHLFAEVPSWARVACYCLFPYAVLNFIYFIYCTKLFPRHAVPFLVELRGFSGHWMLFYGWEAAGFLGLASFVGKRKEQ